MRAKLKFDLEKNGAHMPSIVWEVGQLLLGRQTIFLQFTKFLKFTNFNSEARLGCLNGFKASAHGFVPIDTWPVFEGNAIVQMLFRNP